MKDRIWGRTGQNNRKDSGCSPTGVLGDYSIRKCSEEQVLMKQVFEMEKNMAFSQTCHCLSFMGDATTFLKKQRHCLT